MDIAGIKPGPKLGNILYAIFDEVIENPSLNNEEYLNKRALELSTMSDKEVYDLGKKGKEIKEIKEESRIKEIRGKHHVD